MNQVLDSFSLKGKRVLLTGGAGQYGRQMASAYAQAGADVYMASRNQEALEEVARSFRKDGYRVSALPVDQADEASILALRDELITSVGKLDVLVNNAVARPLTDAYHSDMAQIEASMKVNATGLILMTRIIGEIINDGGSIINIGSIMGMVGAEPANYAGTDIDGWYPDYYFHKGGMINLTRFLASYYGQRSIRVNCISAGGLAHHSQPAAFTKNYSERTCLNRLARDSDLMGAAVFLASDASTYITGVNLPVDGGYTAK